MKQLCIVFDLDDTLYLEKDYVRSGFRALESWAKLNFGLEDFYAKAWVLFERGERGNIFDSVFREAGLKPDRNTIQTMVDQYRGHKPEIQLAADAAECLESIQDRVHLSLITDGPQRSQENKIKALGLEQTFEPAVLTSALGIDCAKPREDGFLAVQKHCGPTVQEYLYVADNPMKDFAAPRRLGWKTIRVRRRQGLHYSVEPSCADYSSHIEIQDLGSLTSIIDSGNYHEI